MLIISKITDGIGLRRMIKKSPNRVKNKIRREMNRYPELLFFFMGYYTDMPDLCGSTSDKLIYGGINKMGDGWVENTEDYVGIEFLFEFNYLASDFDKIILTRKEMMKLLEVR